MIPSSRVAGTSQAQSARHVNNLLHTLRGEQFRHAQNARHSRAHISSQMHVHSGPTLPALDTLSELILQMESSINNNNGTAPPAPDTFDELTSEETSISRVSNLSSLPLPDFPQRRYSGPVAPKSWTRHIHLHDSPAWRADALSIALPALADVMSAPIGSVDEDNLHVPPLTLICLRTLLSSYSGSDFKDYIIPHLPPHLRRDLLRYTAIHAPLTSPKLYALCEPEGHADGELIIIGPFSSLRANHFRQTTNEDDPSDEEPSWESPGRWDSSTPFHTLIILSSQLTVSNLLTFPPTLTCLVLVNIPNPIPIHHLPNVCHLLEVLDLSYNNWIDYDRFLMVKWDKLRQLRVLGLKGCSLDHNTVALRLNKSRWNDVQIIRSTNDKR